MKNPLFTMSYCDTYYLSQVVNGVLTDPVPYIRHLDEFFGDLNYRRFLKPFPKFSALHDFISFSIDKLVDDDVEQFCAGDIQGNIGKRSLWVSALLESHEVSHPPLDGWLASQGVQPGDADEDVIWDYYNEVLAEPYESLASGMIEEAFFILFLNRRVLHALNTMAAHAVADSGMGFSQDEEQYYARDGALKRVHIPEWVRRAVFHRDRGCCSSCHRDLTGLITVSETKHFDHIIALAAGGINDVTNIQLLCEQCNTSKKDRNHEVSNIYQKWY